MVDGFACFTGAGNETPVTSAAAQSRVFLAPPWSGGLVFSCKQCNVVVSPAVLLFSDLFALLAPAQAKSWPAIAVFRGTKAGARIKRVPSFLAAATGRSDCKSSTNSVSREIECPVKSRLSRTSRVGHAARDGGTRWRAF